MTRPLLLGLGLVALGAVGAASTWGALAGHGLLGRRRPARGRVLRWPFDLAVSSTAILAVVACIAGSTITVWAVAVAAGDRSPRSIELGPGIAYERVALDGDRPQVVHVATVELDRLGPASCLSFVTTIPAPDGTVAAETGSAFLARTGAALSINVAFFYPIDFSIFGGYPDSGDPITAIGPVVVDGVTYGRGADGWGVGVGVADGRGFAGPVPAGAELAVPGRERLVVDGRIVAPESSPYPRTVAGVDVDRNALVLVTADGKQPGYAEGSTYAEVAELLVERGVDDAVELDGGGSSTMVGRMDDGGPAAAIEVLNRPINRRQPGRERPVATHLGVRVDADCGSP